MGLFSWIGTAAERVGSGIATAATAVGSAAVALTKPETYVAAANGVAAGVNWVNNKVAEGAVATYNGAKWVAENPGKAWEATKSGVATAAVATYNFGKYVVQNPGRAMYLAQQGLANAAASTVGMVGNVVIAGAWNYTVRPLINLGLDKKDMIDRAKFDCSDYLTEKVQVGQYIPDSWTGLKKLTAPIDPKDPNANYERVVLYGSQAVGEVGAFIGVTVATAGTGSAAFAMARGGAYAAKGARMARLFEVAQDSVALAAKMRAPEALADTSRLSRVLAATRGAVPTAVTTTARTTFGLSAKGINLLGDTRLAGALGRGFNTSARLYRWSMPLHRAGAEGWKVSRFASAMEVGGAGLSFGMNYTKSLKEGNTQIQVQAGADKSHTGNVDRLRKLREQRDAPGGKPVPPPPPADKSKPVPPPKPDKQDDTSAPPRRRAPRVATRTEDRPRRQDVAFTNTQISSPGLSMQTNLVYNPEGASLTQPGDVANALDDNRIGEKIVTAIAAVLTSDMQDGGAKSTPDLTTSFADLARPAAPGADKGILGAPFTGAAAPRPVAPVLVQAVVQPEKTPALTGSNTSLNATV